MTDQERAIDPAALAAGLGLDAKFVHDVLGEGPTSLGLPEVPSVSVVTDPTLSRRTSPACGPLDGAPHDAVRAWAPSQTDEGAENLLRDDPGRRARAM